MKKLFKTIMSVALAATMTFSIVGCGGNADGGAQDLQIYVLNQGYGVDWAYTIKDAFIAESWVQDKYPNLNVTIEENDQRAFANSKMSAQKDNYFDILFGNTMTGFYGDDTQVLELTDLVYNKEVPGESVLYKDKMINSTRMSYVYVQPSDPNATERYYGVPWQGGTAGILYNEEMLAEYELEVPRTTDEFLACCEAVAVANRSKDDKDKTKKYAILASMEAQYWDMHMLDTWWAQYDTIQGYIDFYEGRDEDGMRTNAIFDRKGRLEALKVFEQFMDNSKGYISPRAFADLFMVAQQSYLLGASLFYCNGDWFSKEMESSVELLESNGQTLPTIKMMRTPVLSSIAIDQCDTIENDAELSALIKAIDNGSLELKGEGYEVNQADFDRIVEARFTTDGVGGGTVAGIIPVYAEAKDVAVDFFRFMASDKGIIAYAKGSAGATLDYKCNIAEKYPDDFATFPALAQEKIKYFNDANHEIRLVPAAQSFALFNYADLKPFVDDKYWAALTAKAKEKTAEDFFNETKKAWDEKKFNDALSKAGLN